MSEASEFNRKISTSTVASTPETIQLQQAPFHPTSTEHEQPSYATLAADSTTTPSDDNILSTTPNEATSETSEEPTSDASRTASHVSHEEMQPLQGEPLRVLVTDCDAESMICWDGSVDACVLMPSLRRYA